ncbi:MAG TPA: radical SAM protein [Bryobacteraceae bacterium]|nr:radical SAM protein [Bryobacteraceae bacterium]
MTASVQSIPVLVLYPHARCNCRCVMCDIWKGTSEAELSAEELARHLADIETLQVKWVVFSGGEPLMHSDLFRLSDMLRSRGIRVTILSTGLLLKRFAKEVVAHVDDVIVSLDGPPHIHDQIRRIRGAFVQLEQGIGAIRNRNPKFPIAARCTVQRSNHNALAETAELAKLLQLDSISLLAADLTSEAFNREERWDEERQAAVSLTRDELDTLDRQLESVWLEWGETGFVLESYEKLRRISRHFRAHLGLCEPEAPRCNAPWVSAVVEANGVVRPCFFHRPIGSLQSQTLIQVLNGFEAQRFRQSLDVATNAVCRRCVCSLHLQ